VNRPCKTAAALWRGTNPVPPFANAPAPPEAEGEPNKELPSLDEDGGRVKLYALHGSFWFFADDGLGRVTQAAFPSMLIVSYSFAGHE
jgi:hypothetical protein